MEAWMFWLALMLILLVIEVLIVDLTFLMFAGGALVAGIAALLGAPVVFQVVAFGVTSTLLLVAIRPWALRKFRKPTAESATNINALIGKPATVVAATSQTEGRVKLRGEVWSARFEGVGTLQPGTPVTVVRIDGATAVVAQSVSNDPTVSAPVDPTNPYGTQSA